MWKKEIDPFMRAKIECFAANQLVLVLDGVVLMMTEKLYSKVLLIFVMIFMACSNVYVYYREVKRNETLEKLENDKYGERKNEFIDEDED